MAGIKSRKANWTDREVSVLVEECTDKYDIITGKHGEVNESQKSEFWRKTSERY